MDCLIRFFSKKLGYVPSVDPDLPRVRPDFKVGAARVDDSGSLPSKSHSSQVLCAFQPNPQMAAPSMGDLDADLRASGFKREDQEVLDR